MARNSPRPAYEEMYLMDCERGLYLEKKENPDFDLKGAIEELWMTDEEKDAVHAKKRAYYEEHVKPLEDRITAMERERSGFWNKLIFVLSLAWIFGG